MSALSLITGLALVLSVASAMWVDRFLTVRVPLLGSFAGLELSHNPGIAFGIRLPPVLQEILIGIALVIVAIIAVRSARQMPNSQFSFGLILGGGIANIIDRIPDGLVTDFIQIGSFPTFNIADSCITVGAALLLVESLWSARKDGMES
jgi:signal peptidase II